MINNSWKKSLFTWLLIILFGLLVLAGRYDWSAEVSKYSFRSYVASAYFFCWFLPVLYYLLIFLGASEKAARITSIISFFIQTLPIHLLGLSKFYYYDKAHPPYIYWNHLPIQPKFTWFPQALYEGQVIPYEYFFFGLVSIVFVSSVYCYAKFFQKTDFFSRKVALILILGFFVIFQSWLHLSLRSPNSYRNFFTAAAETQSWYHAYLFADGRGHVNGDYFVFRNTEEMFMNNSKELFDTMPFRAFPMYIVSQFSYFTNSFYAWLFLNIFAWGFAIYALTKVARRNFGDDAAFYTAVFTVISPVFIQYVAQAMSYVIAYAVITLLVLMFDQIFNSREKISGRDSLLLGGVFGLSLLTFELHPWLLVFVILAVYKKFAFRNIFAVIFLSMICPSLYLRIIDQFDSVKVLENKEALFAPLRVFLAVFTELHFSKLYNLVVDFTAAYPRNLFASFQVPFLIAFGAFFIDMKTKHKVALMLVLLPSFMTQAFFQFDEGKFHYQNSARIVVPAFPAIFILAGLVMAKIKQINLPYIGSKLVYSCIWALILLQFLIANTDVFGYPVVYYLMLWRLGNPWII